MLQELSLPRERRLRRFQNPKAYPVHRLSKRNSSSSSNGQRRHTSHATARSTRTFSQSHQNNGSSSSTPSSSSSTMSETNRPPHLIHLARYTRVDVENLRLDDAWRSFITFLADKEGVERTTRDNQDHIIVLFAERFCDKIELLYEKDDSIYELKIQRQRFRKMVYWLQARIHVSESMRRHVTSIQHLLARCRSMHGQFEAAIEILEKIRVPGSQADLMIAKTYTSLYSAIFHFQDALHVVEFLKSHFFKEYFHPPYCFYFRDEGVAALVNRHPRLLFILSSLQDPVSLIKSQEVPNERNWVQITVLLILAYCRYKQPQLAFCVYEAAFESQDCFTDNRFPYDLLKLRLVRALAQDNYFDDANRLYNEVPATAPEHMNTGMHLFALQGRLNSMDSTPKLSKHHRVMGLLNLAIRGHVTQLHHRFEEYYPRDENESYRRTKPQVMDYAIAIYCYARCSDPEGIDYWIERMTKDRLKPNLYVYSSMIQSHFRSGNLEAITTVLDRMREAGIAPNVVIYTNIITALNKHHKPSTAEGIFKRALLEKVMPDQAMVGALLNCYVDAGQWNEAIRLFRSLEENTRSPLKLTIEMYNIALKGYVIMGAPFRVVATLFERLDANRNIKPTPVTFALLLQSACEAGYMGAAMDIFREMDKRATSGTQSLMNPFTFTILMAGFLRKGDKERALQVYQDMIDRGINPTSVTFNTVLHYYSNEQAAGSLQVAYEFMTRVATRQGDITGEENLQLSPINLVYEPLLRGYSSNGNVEGFERLLDEMLDAGGEVNVSVLTYLLDLYRQKDRLQQATKVWNHLLELGVEKMAAAKFPQEGKDDIESSTDMLCVPLTIYLDTLSRSEEHDRVLEVWQEYQKQGFSFNFFNWNRLGEYLIRAGEYERAFEVVDRIILPYIRVVRNEARTSTASDSTETVDEEQEPTWRPPFDVLNKTDLSFLNAIITPIRPFSGSTRSKIIRYRSQRDSSDDAATVLALNHPPTPTVSTPPPLPMPTSEEEEEFDPTLDSFGAPDETQPDRSYLPFVASRPSTSDDLSFETIPDFLRPLYTLSFTSVGNNPRIHWSLLHHLLIGLQRLRAGQPAVQTSTPGQMSDADLYGVDYSPEQQKRVRALLEKIFKEYPDAVKVVMEFDEQEKYRLADNYDKVYIWN